MVYREGLDVVLEAVDIQELTLLGVDPIPERMDADTAVVWAIGMRRRALGMEDEATRSFDSVRKANLSEAAARGRQINGFSLISRRVFDACPEEHFAYLLDNPEIKV